MTGQTVDTSSPYELPTDLPIPIDDGAAIHLLHAAIPYLSLPSTRGGNVELAQACAGPAVLFFYPRTGIPGQPPHPGFNGEEWDSIPGARGCTPQSCGFRNLHAQFSALGVRVLGISTSTTDHQREFADRTHIPFDLLSDADLRLTHAMSLPTFEFPVESGGPTTLLRRMAWYLEGGRIRKVWYPVFPPDRNAATVLEWVSLRRRIQVSPIGAGDIDFVRAELHRNWHSTVIYSLDRRYDADQLPGYVARPVDNHAPVGLITLYHDANARQTEVITLSAATDSGGIGSALLDAALDDARRRGHQRLFLTTTNDNLRALAFYQRRGLRLAKVHPGMMDRYRATHSPAIPIVGKNGIAMRDEVEIEYIFEVAS